MDNLYPECSWCGKTPQQGLYDGFRLAGKFICTICEQHLLKADIGTQDYQTNVENMRKVLYS